MAASVSSVPMPRMLRLMSSASAAVSPVIPLLTPGRVWSASAMRMMPWRSSSSVLTVLVNVAGLLQRVAGACRGYRNRAQVARTAVH